MTRRYLNGNEHLAHRQIYQDFWPEKMFLSLCKRAFCKRTLQESCQKCPAGILLFRKTL